MEVGRKTRMMLGGSGEHIMRDGSNEASIDCLDKGAAVKMNIMEGNVRAVTGAEYSTPAIHYSEV